MLFCYCFGNNSYMNKINMLPCAFGVSAIKNNKKISCVITAGGRCKVMTEKNKKYNKLKDLFLIRGVIYLLFNIYHVVLGIFSYNNLYASNSIVLNKAKNSLNISIKNILIFLIVICGMVLAVLMFGILPIKISFYITPKNFDLFLKRIVIGLIKCLLIYLFLLILKFIPTFSQYYKFNSAINSYQQSNNQINFLTYLICSIFLGTIILSILALPASLWYSVIINLLITLCVFAINYEIYIEIQKSKVLRHIITPFYFLIKEKYSQKEEKCVNIVLKELELGGMSIMKAKDDDILFSEAYINAKAKLENAKKYEKSDLDFIFCEILNKNRAELKLVKTITRSDYKKVLKAVERRCKGEPVTKIFGSANFYGLNFEVTRDVLSPRMDTEILVEQVIKNCNPKTKVLDIGTGSGAIAITIAKLTNCKVVAVDISDKALDVAKRNAKANNTNVTFKKSDLFSGLGKLIKFDIIVSNPPYIPTADISTLDEEVKNFDPVLALDGGESGLEFYKSIIDEAPRKLSKRGMIFFEVGINQAKDVKKLLQNSFEDIKIVKDFNKIERVVIATLK